MVEVASSVTISSMQGEAITKTGSTSAEIELVKFVDVKPAQVTTPRCVLSFYSYCFSGAEKTDAKC